MGSRIPVLQAEMQLNHSTKAQFGSPELLQEEHTHGSELRWRRGSWVRLCAGVALPLEEGIEVTRGYRKSSWTGRGPGPYYGTFERTKIAPVCSQWGQQEGSWC